MHKDVSQSVGKPPEAPRGVGKRRRKWETSVGKWRSVERCRELGDSRGQQGSVKRVENILNAQIHQAGRYMVYHRNKRIKGNLVYVFWGIHQENPVFTF
jgi:hypothetical protein